MRKLLAPSFVRLLLSHGSTVSVLYKNYVRSMWRYRDRRGVDFKLICVHFYFASGFSLGLVIIIIIIIYSFK